MNTLAKFSTRAANYYKVALKLSKQSAHNKHKMAAVLVKGGAVLTKATNKNTWGAHAERRVLQRNPNCVGGTLYIARESGLVSKPCLNCLNLIKQLGIKKIVYVDKSGQLISEKI